MTAPDRRAGDAESLRLPGADPYREWDAAYVLGALSPSERREFEEHLTSCPTCPTGVAELAGIPGLLTQLSVEEALTVLDESDPSESAGPPPGPQTGPVAPFGQSGVPTPLPLENRRLRRLTRALVAVAAAFVLLAGLVGVAVLHGRFDLGPPSAGAPARIAFRPVVPSEITAVVDVVPVSTGTDLRVECQYATDGPPSAYAGPDYAIVVIDRSGHATQVKTWTARPNHVMTPTGPTPLRVSQIAAVEIRPAGSAQALLRAELG